MTRIRLALALLLLALPCAARAQNFFGATHTTPPASNDNSDLVPTTSWVRTLVPTIALPLAGGQMTGAISFPLQGTLFGLSGQFVIEIPTTTGVFNVNNHMGVPLFTVDGLAGTAAVAATISGQGLISTGPTFAVTGGSASSPTGGSTAGTFVSGATGLQTFVVTFGGIGLAPTGWSCGMTDITSGVNGAQAGSSTTNTATFHQNTTSGDTVSFHCIGY